MRKWVSEIVTVDEVQSWDEGDIITDFPHVTF
ncbi:hypothetical protein SAMN05443094_101274 [Domibacillus enclensis]|uniref:Uncharacterized protein n=1 Tax=Domibacillus enclensis TaxID=1017273 RepID=A0A1N6NU94_9BACI|nr:hypothetical protein SAMN05443094_101274 [Domibacillus enclensis]